MRAKIAIREPAPLPLYDRRRRHRRHSSRELTRDLDARIRERIALQGARERIRSSKLAPEERLQTDAPDETF
jgi:hypothetical protein